MLSSVLFGHIPFENQISQPEILLIVLPVKDLLDFSLMVMHSVYHLFSGLLHFHQLMYPYNHIMRLFLVISEEFRYRQGKVRRKNCFSPIDMLKRGEAQGSLCFHSINP
jgi:hypothetical protein